jgi:uncharacterized BrkB/YihY/UPF0761 family membrane protein
VGPRLTLAVGTLGFTGTAVKSVPTNACRRSSLAGWALRWRVFRLCVPPIAFVGLSLVYFLLPARETRSHDWVVLLGGALLGCGAALVWNAQVTRG